MTKYYLKKTEMKEILAKKYKTSVEKVSFEYDSLGDVFVVYIKEKNTEGHGIVSMFG